MPDVVEPDHLAAAAALRSLYAVYRDSEDLVRLGAYERGTDPELDLAVSRVDAIHDYLRQPVDELAAYPAAVEQLVEGLALDLPRA